ncbi:MAG: iron-containing alcohol dehydrogenase, partial [Actinomycetota bacterium]
FHLAESEEAARDAEADAADAVPLAMSDPNYEPVARLGDLFLISGKFGEHRVLCGDARSKAAVETVLGAWTVALVLTDPPYDVPISGHVSGLGKVKHREFVAVPTTAGTGSEVGRAGVVIDEAARRKVIVFHPKLLPVTVIADPELTVGLPRTLTVGTGLDALSHSLEAICSPVLHPMSHGIGMEGCRLVFEHLPRVIVDPADIDSRGQMLIAAAMGAVAFQKGLGAMHALAHPIGATFDTHHGMTNAVVMPYVLDANRSAIEPTIERLAAYTGVDGGFDGLLDHIVTMRHEMDVPHTLADLGVDPGAVDDIAAAAVLDPSAGTNPIPIDHGFAAAIFSAACAGDLRAA